jgi:hypothetical protein
MNGGIDQQIQQKVDAYRGNPQALQQRYAQNQQLIDLLALQKLKSEKEAAARDIQMKMQQSPQTIKDQREAELMQMTKDDLAKQTGQLLEQRQARSQNNLQRVAQAGLPAAMPGQVQMAGGGIVAFSNGGSTSLTKEEERERMLEAERRRAARLRGNSGLFGGGRNVLGTPANQKLLAAKGFEPDIDMEGEDPFVTFDTLNQPSAPAPAPQTQQTQPAPQQGGITSIPDVTAPQIGMPTQTISKIQAAEAEALDPETQALLTQSMGEASELMKRDPTAIRKEMEKDAGELLGRTRVRDTYADMERRLAELDARQMDPKKLQQEKLLGILGAVGRGNKARTSIAFDEQRRQAERTRMMERMGIQREGLKTDFDIGKSQLDSGQKGFEQTALGERAGLGAGVEIANKEKQVLSEQATRENEIRKAEQVRETELYKVEAARLRDQAKYDFEAQKTNVQTRVKELEIEENKKLRTDLAKYNSAESLRRDISKLAIELDTARQSGLMADPRYGKLKDNVAKAESKSELARAQAELDRYEEERDVELIKQNAQKIAQLNAYRNRLAQIEGTSSGVSANDVTSMRQVSQ